MNNIKKIVEFIYWLYQLYLTKNEAFDELIEDSRDYELLGNAIDPNMPKKFIFEPRKFVNQNVDWYKMSCTAQATCEASNTIRKIKADKTNNSWFTHWDYMVEQGLWWRQRWAYLIDAIKSAKDRWILDMYYRVRSIEQMKDVIYSYSTLIVTWSSKINRTRLKQTNYIVDKVDSWYWHAFYVLWFDDEKELIVCANSYWDKYWDKGKFYIPYNLFFDLVFNSCYSIVVNPEWTKLSREELFEKFSILKK